MFAEVAGEDGLVDEVRGDTDTQAAATTVAHVVADVRLTVIVVSFTTFHHPQSGPWQPFTSL